MTAAEESRSRGCQPARLPQSRKTGIYHPSKRTYHPTSFSRFQPRLDSQTTSSKHWTASAIHPHIPYALHWHNRGSNGCVPPDSRSALWTNCDYPRIVCVYNVQLTKSVTRHAKFCHFSKPVLHSSTSCRDSDGCCTKSNRFGIQTLTQSDRFIRSRT
jgi:hypothetical protein